jgi:hypothetical protein
VGPCPARQQALEGVRRGTQEGRGDANRWGDPDRVAIPRHVLDGDPSLLARDPRPDGAAGRGQVLQPRHGRCQPAFGPCRHLGRRQIAQAAQEVVDAIERGRVPVVGEMLQVELELDQRLRVEQLAQLLLAEQLPQEAAVERQRAGPPLGDRRVALVHVRGDVVEHQARRERRRLHGLDAVDGDLSPPDAGQDVAQGRQVEDVGQALAVRLDEDRERAVPRRDRQQIGRPLALLPERRPRPRPAARQQ